MVNSVFITDGLLRKSLATVRALGEAGIDVLVGEKTSWTISHYSKYTKSKFCYPDPKERPNDFVAWIDTHLNKGTWEVFFPMDDAVMDLAIQNRIQWEKRCRIVLPPTISYYQLRDKYQAVQLAKKAGLHCPDTYIVQTIDEVEAISKSIQFPVVVKPRFESGSRGIKVIHSREELMGHFQRYNTPEDFPMIQEYIPAGVRYDVGLLYDYHHEAKACFIQREIRHYPIKMGPSTVQESIHDDELLQKCLDLMGQLPWTGIVEIEFMVDPRNNQPVFMEANPRLWNSLACAIESGVNFPVLLYELAVNGEIKSTQSYRPNIYCRNLLPGDFLHFLVNPERRKMNPPLLSWGKRVGVDDILSKKDPLPFIGFILTCIRYVFSRKAWNQLVKRS